MEGDGRRGGVYMEARAEAGGGEVHVTASGGEGARGGSPGGRGECEWSGAAGPHAERTERNGAAFGPRSIHV